jgi:hypothetical protein
VASFSLMNLMMPGGRRRREGVRRVGVGDAGARDGLAVLAGDRRAGALDGRTLV